MAQLIFQSCYCKKPVLKKAYVQNFSDGTDTDTETVYVPSVKFQISLRNKVK